MRHAVVFITVPHAREGRTLARLLVGRRLAACVNRIPGLTSLYWWKGKIETAREELLIAKTTVDRFPALIREVRRSHSYTVPEIVAVPIVAGNPDYLSWIGSSVRGADRSRARKKGKP